MPACLLPRLLAQHTRRTHSVHSTQPRAGAPAQESAQERHPCLHPPCLHRPHPRGAARHRVARQGKAVPLSANPTPTAPPRPPGLHTPCEQNIANKPGQHRTPALTPRIAKRMRIASMSAPAGSPATSPTRVYCASNRVSTREALHTPCAVSRASAPSPSRAQQGSVPVQRRECRP